MLETFLIFGLLMGQNNPPSQTPNDSRLGNPQNITEPSQRASENQDNDGKRAIAIKPSFAVKADAKAASDESKTPNDPKKTWSISDRIAVGACIAAFAQFLALIATIWIMIRNGRRQLRAHVFPDDITIADGTLLTPPEMHKADMPAISIVIKNSGQTPAYNVISWWEIKVIPTKEEDSLIIPVLQKKHSTSVGTGCTFNKGLWFERTLTIDERAKIFDGTLGVYAHGRIEYQDVFKVRHFSNFRLVYTGKVFPPIRGAVMTFCEQGNNAN